MTAPIWLSNLIQDARQLLGVGGVEWSIYAKVTDKPGGDASNAGWVKTNYRYLSADIELLDTLTPGTHARQIVLHEVGHIAHYEIDSVAEMMLAQLDDDRREVFSQMYDEALERYLQRLSKSLAYNVKPEEAE